LTVREIRLYGDPVLTSPSDAITDFAKATQLITDLLETTELPGRAGVAAPQIGVGLRAFSYHVDSQLGYLINPRIVETRGELALVDEGCLSLPGLWHPTPRYSEVIAEGFDLDGKVIRLHGKGLLAQAIQHECDHLDGKLYIDRLELDERRLAMKKLRESDWFTS